MQDFVKRMIVIMYNKICTTQEACAFNVVRASTIICQSLSVSSIIFLDLLSSLCFPFTASYFTCVSHVVHSRLMNVYRDAPRSKLYFRAGN